MIMKRLYKKILKSKKKEVKDLRRDFNEDMLKAAAFSVGGEFRSIEITVQQSQQMPVFVDLKSILFPESHLVEGFQPLRIAQNLINCGLDSGVIVATDKTFLGGDPSWLNLIKQHTELPVIQRDFFIDPVQIYQSKAIGADAVIINSTLIDHATLTSLVDAANSMGLEVFLELEIPEHSTGINLESFTGVILSEELIANLRNPWDSLSKFLSSFPSHLVTLATIYPTSPAELERIATSGVSGIILANEFWRRESFVTQFQTIRNWCENVLPAK